MIRILLLLLLLATNAYSFGGMMCASGGTTGTAEPPAACITQAAPTDRDTFTDGGTFCTNASVDDWFFSEFEAGEDATICKFCIPFASSTSTSPSYNLVGYIYSKTGSVPDAALENGTYSTESLAGKLSNAGYTEICFDGGSASVTNGTRYFLVINCSDIDLTNQLKVGRDTDCPDADTNQVRNMGRSASGSSWSTTTTYRCAMQTLWK